MSGTARDLVLLHGWGTTPGVWQPLAQCLGAGFRVHAPALPGYADAPACEPCTLDALVTAVAELSPARGAVCGWSLGALVALAWALREPQRIERLVLIAATPCFARRKDWSEGVEPGLLESFADGLAGDALAVLTRFVALEALGDANSARVRRELSRHIARRAGADTLRSGLDVLRTTDLRPALGRVVQRTLVIHGERDAVTPHAAGAALARALPRARFETIDGAGHAPFVAQAETIAALVGAFLGDD